MTHFFNYNEHQWKVLYKKIFIASFAERRIFVFTVWQIYTILAKHFSLRFHCKLTTQNPFSKLVWSLLPWVPEAFHAQFPVSVKFRCSCLRPLADRTAADETKLPVAHEKKPEISRVEVSIILCLFHSCWLGITSISVFFIFPFFIVPVPFEIA